jgi:hypothetical protein
MYPELARKIEREKNAKPKAAVKASTATVAEKK